MLGFPCSTLFIKCDNFLVHPSFLLFHTRANVCLGNTYGTRYTLKFIFTEVLKKSNMFIYSVYNNAIWCACGRFRSTMMCSRVLFNTRKREWFSVFIKSICTSAVVEKMTWSCQQVLVTSRTNCILLVSRPLGNKFLAH